MSNNTITSIREKLSRILTYKNQIKTEAVAKGAEITDETTLREYPSKIAAITVGSGGSESSGEIIYGVYTSSSQSLLSSTYIRYNPLCFNVILPSYITKIGSSAFWNNGGFLSSCTADPARQGSYISPIIGALMGKIRGDNVTEIRGMAFYQCGFLSKAEFPSLLSMSVSAFAYCKKLNTFNAPNVSVIGADCFFACNALSSVNFSKVEDIPSRCFYTCSALSTYNFENVKTLGEGCFNNAGITRVDMSKVTSINSSAFSGCKSLSYVSLPYYSGLLEFFNCTALNTLYAPQCTSIGHLAYTGISELYMPKCISIGYSAFTSNARILKAHFGSVISLPYSAFRSCTKLSYLRFDGLSSISASTSYSYTTFYNCSNLISLYLLGSNVCTLGNSNAFSSTPIVGYTSYAGQLGRIYVRKSLLTAYQSATNWVYHESRFAGLTDAEIAALPY